MTHWLDKLASRLRRRRLELPPAPLPPPSFLAGGGAVGRARELQAYQGWVYAAVNLIAQRVAGLPLRLFRDEGPGGGPEINRHPVLDLLQRPNPLMTGRQLRFTLATHLELTGMAFLLVAENALGRPAELWPLNPADLIEITAGPDTRRPITAFRFARPGGESLHRPEELLYFRHPSPTSLLYGASPVEAMAHAYDIDLAVRIYQRNFFRNAARPEVVLSTDQRLTEEEARRILTRWNQKHQGLAHVFEPTLLDGGLKAAPLAYSAKDFEFAALAGWTQDNILAAYGVPAGKLGLVKDVNRANAHGIDVTFNSECIRPRLELVEDVLQNFLLPRYGQGMCLKHDNPVPSDRAQAHREAMACLDRGVMTINEVRAQLGKGPVAWGDEPYHPAGQAPGPLPAMDEPLDAELRARGLERLRRGYPRLLAHFAGWSAARVRRELLERPRLLEGLLPSGLGAAQTAAWLAAVQSGLEQGLSLDETAARITRQAAPAAGGKEA